MRTIHGKIRKATSTPVGKIIFFTIVFLIIAGIAGGLIYWRYYRKQIIRNSLENTISSKTKGLYALKYDELKLDEMGGFLSVTNLRLTYDSARYAALAGQDLAPSTLLRIYIPQLTVTGVKTPRALIDKEIVGQALTLTKPEIEIIYTNAGKDSARNVPTREIYRQILGDLNLIRIDTVTIAGGTISTRNIRNKTKNIELNNTGVVLIGVAIDSAANEDTTRILFAKNVYLAAESVKWGTADGRYNFKVDSITMQSTSRDLFVKRFRMIPRSGEDAFVKSLPTQDDRFDFRFSKIRIRNIDLGQLFDENLVADTVQISAANMLIYRDLNIPRDKKNRVGTYPHQAIARIPLPIRIQTLQLFNTYVEYKEKSAITKQAGRVQFYKATATFTNLTNRKQDIEENNIMTVDINTSFMNRTPLRARWTFFLFNPQGRFNIEGSLGKINAADLNVLTEPMGPARIEEGTINGMNFNLAGNDNHLAGTVKLLYDDLKITVLGKDGDTKKIEKKTLATIAANFIVKNSNPSRRNAEPRVIQVDEPRDKNRSIFNLTWKTLFKGIRETVGIKK